MQCVRYAGELLTKCTALDPSQRLDASQALKHPFCEQVLKVEEPVGQSHRSGNQKNQRQRSGNQRSAINPR